jgi:hypothetical protein
MNFDAGVQLISNLKNKLKINGVLIVFIEPSHTNP